MHIVYTEYDRDLSLDVIADRLHYNPNYLSNVFKKETGEKFGDFVQNHRLEVAKKWLKETNLSVKEIAISKSAKFYSFLQKERINHSGRISKKIFVKQEAVFLVV